MNRHYSNRSSAHSTNELQLIGALSRIAKSEKIAKWYLSLICRLPIRRPGRRIAVAGFAFNLSIHNFLQFVAAV